VARDNNAMRTCWVLGGEFDSHLDKVESIKAVAPVWGSHYSWREFGTDNVICHDLPIAINLLKRAFQAVCNFYVPKDRYIDLGRPNGVKMYDGSFSGEMFHKDEIIALHLVASQNDIVLLLGFNLAHRDFGDNKLGKHQWTNYLLAVKTVIANNPNTQWVAIDQISDIHPDIKNLTNFTCDKIENVVHLLV
jgi:hypothetical protein